MKRLSLYFLPSLAWGAYLASVRDWQNLALEAAVGTLCVVMCLLMKAA